MTVFAFSLTSVAVLSTYYQKVHATHYLLDSSLHISLIIGYTEFLNSQLQLEVGFMSDKVFGAYRELLLALGGVALRPLPTDTSMRH